MIRAIRHYTGLTGPDTYETKYETRDFDCPELEAFILGEGIHKNIGASFGFTGIEVIERKRTELHIMGSSIFHMESQKTDTEKTLEPDL